jgi:four helix bundle protein
MNNVSEAQFSESRKDFIHKLKVAQKEVNEGRNIAKTLTDEEDVDQDVVAEFLDLADQIGRMLTSSISTATKNLKAKQEKKDDKSD